jgi:hypothetical protein
VKPPATAKARRIARRKAKSGTKGTVTPTFDPRPLVRNRVIQP